MRAAALLVLFAAGCSDSSRPPVEVSSGGLVARIYPDPARIALVIQGQEVWTTQGKASGGDGPPDGFAAIGSVAATVEMQFGSFKFTENTDAETWQKVTSLSDIEPTADGATFVMHGNDRTLGTGSLTFVTSTRSGPDPDAANLPRHVRITLTADKAQRIAMATPCEADEHFVGLGGQSMDIDHHGETVPLWVQEDGIGKYPDPDDSYQGVWFLTGRKHSTHTPMPMLLSSRGYALAVDTDSRAIFDLCHSYEQSARYESWSNQLDLQVFLGAEEQGGLSKVADAFGYMIAWVGKPARPPDLIFAPWIDALFGSVNVRRVAQKLRDNGVSSSVIWTEDWRGGATSATGYALDEDWNVDRGLYPDFEQLATDLHAMGFAFHVYENTFIDSTADIRTQAVASGFSIHKDDGTPYDFTGVKFNPSTMLDLTNPEAVSWAKGVMTTAITQGADGWMADFAEWLPTDAKIYSGDDPLMQAHNRYTVQWAKMNKEMFATTPAGRPPGIYFMRSAWLHSQPNVMVMWAGDQQTDFSDGDGFPSVIPIGLGMGLAGLPYFGSDIGGYMSQGTVSTSEELFYRWTTLGALSPVMRTHHGRNVTTNVQWEYNAGTVAHFARWSRFHMQLAAYLSGSIGSYERDGLPLFRSLLLDDPTDDWTWTTIDEYQLGDRIVVAPILQEGATTREVKLPGPEPWYPLFGGPYIDHAIGMSITATAPKEEIPAYVPMGSILVLYPQNTPTLLPSAPIDREVWLFRGPVYRQDFARWNDMTGPIGTPNWTWNGGASPEAALPTTATFNGASVPVTIAGEVATLTVTGDGTLHFADNSELTIARGLASAKTIVRLR